MKTRDLFIPLFEEQRLAEALQDLSGWMHHSGKIVSGSPRDPGDKFEPHYLVIKQNWKEMGVPEEAANAAVDEYLGLAQLEAYEAGWIRFYISSDELTMSAPRELYQKAYPRILKMIRSLRPRGVELDLIDYTKARAKGGQPLVIGDSFEGTDLMGIRQWLRYPSGEGD